MWALTSTLVSSTLSYMISTGTLGGEEKSVAFLWALVADTLNRVPKVAVAGALIAAVVPLAFSRTVTEADTSKREAVLDDSMSKRVQLPKGETHTGTTSESLARQRLTGPVVKPVYPPDAIRDGTQGLTVAAVRIRPDGSVASIEMLTAPCESIAIAVKAAVGGWHFRSFKDAEQLSGGLRFKITYYFVRLQGRWTVLDPTEKFFVGPRFAK